MPAIKSKRIVQALLGSCVVIAAIVGLACIPHLDDASFLLLPGVLLAALVFPQGIHSDHGWTFIIVAGILDLLLYSLLILLLEPLLRHIRKTPRANGAPT